ncbi:MAG: DUF1501 domain-containing protein [Leptospirales bacterium]|nr:DUF1501 domain-containing protein [Leptospirales bacterium]
MSIDRMIQILRRASMSRGEFLKGAGAALAGAAAAQVFGRRLHAEDIYDDVTLPSPVKSVIFLNMAGGMSHIDTLDPKPGLTNFAAVDSAIPSLRVAETFQKTARVLNHLSVIRTTWSEEGDHGFGQYLLNSGYRMSEGRGFPDLPNFGSMIAYVKKRNAEAGPYFPSQITLGERSGLIGRPGFLGVHYAGFHIGNLNQPVNHLRPAWGRYTPERLARREQLLNIVNGPFKAQNSAAAIGYWDKSFEAALDFMNTDRLSVFDIAREPAALRARFGESWAGKALLMARRLAEAEIPFIQVTLGGWDTHNNNRDRVATICRDLDGAIATLTAELASSGLLKQTLLVLSTEFGRTPEVGGRDGRDHFPSCWTTLIGGGAIPGGVVVGESNEKGTRERQGSERYHWRDVMATIYRAAGIDHEAHLTNSAGRPLPFVPRSAKPIAALLPGA